MVNYISILYVLTLMPKMIVDVDENREEKFRQLVAKVKGLHKGVIKESLEEAIDMWIDAKEKEANEREEIEKQHGGKRR